MKSLVALAVFCAASSAMAHEGEMFEIGTRSVEGSGTELVFEVRTPGYVLGGMRTDDSGRFYVVARTQASVGASLSGGGNAPSYVDVEFKALTVEEFHTFSSGKLYASASALNLKFERDVTLNNGMMAMVNLISLAAGADINATKDLVFFINGSLDLAGLAMAERLSDGTRLNGSGAGAGAKLGATYLGKYRIVLGTDYFEVSGKPRQETGYACYTYRYADYYGDYYHGGTYDPYYDPYYDGYYYTYCGYQTVNVDQAKRSVTNTYLRLQADLSKTISVFGQVGYAVYEASDETGEFPYSQSSKWNLRLGVAVKLHQ